MQVMLLKAADRQGPPILDITKFGYSHYDILSDIMIILDHGNICVDTIFMIIIMHSFPDIDEIMFFYNGCPHLHTHICIFKRQHFLTMKTYV